MTRISILSNKTEWRVPSPHAERKLILVHDVVSLCIRARAHALRMQKLDSLKLPRASTVFMRVSATSAKNQTGRAVGRKGVDQTRTDRSSQHDQPAGANGQAPCKGDLFIHEPRASLEGSTAQACLQRLHRIISLISIKAGLTQSCIRRPPCTHRCRLASRLSLVPLESVEVSFNLVDPMRICGCR